MMIIEGLQNIQNRIAEIEARIASLSGETLQSAEPQKTVKTGFGEIIRSRLIGSMPASDWDSLIDEAADTYSLDPKLIKAVMLSESGGRPDAVSSAGAMGLMQLMPATAESLGVTNPYDPRQNIMGGSRYLKGLLERMGSVELAVAAYNAGPGAVKKYGGIPPYPETQKYVQKVMQHYQGAGND